MSAWDWVDQAPTPTAAPRPKAIRTEPTAGPMAWAADAACRHLDTDLFYPESTSAMDPAVVAACARCPVRPDCLDHALRHEPHGTWAGTSERTRRSMRRSLGIHLEGDTP